MESQAPPRDESFDAREEGIAAHWYAAELAAGRNPGDVAPNGVAITTDMQEGANLLLQELEGPGDLLIETEIQMEHLPRPVTARLDFARVDAQNRRLKVVDYKFGHRYVPAVDNWTLAIYADALRRRFPELAWPYFELVIVQPRSYVSDGPVRRWAPEPERLDSLMLQVVEALEDGETLRTGEHCRNCRAAGSCDALARIGGKLLEEMSLAAPRGLSAPELANELTWLRTAQDRLKARLDALESEAIVKIRDGDGVPGWTLQSTTTPPRWTRPVTDVLALGEAFGIDLAKPSEPCTPLQAIKKGLDESVVQEYSERRPGAAKLVPINLAKAFKS